MEGEEIMYAFMIKYKKALIGATVLSFLCFGFMLTHFTVLIDDETWILSSNSNPLWLLQGRFGIWLFNLIFTRWGSFAPFLWDVLAIAFWNLSGIVFAWALLDSEKPKTWHVFFFCAYYASLPFVVGEIMAFSMFDFQISLAMVATAAAFSMSRQLHEYKSWKKSGVAFLLLLYGVATYQAMLCVYVTAVVADCLLQYLNHRTKLMSEIIACALICIAATVVYAIIDVGVRTLLGTSTYLSDNYNGWSDGNKWLAIALAIANVGRVSFAIPFLDEYIYGGEVIRILSILFVVCAVYLFFRERGGKRKIGILFYTVALCFAPFILYLILATYKTHGRVMLALALSGAVQLYILFVTVQRTAIKKILFVLATYMLFLNARNMNTIYYYSSIVYERDCTVADQLMYDIQRAGMNYREKPVVFVGMVEQDPLPIQTSGTLGGSFFNWDDGNNVRMRNFILSRGYALGIPTTDQLTKGLASTKTMTTWPQEGSIVTAQ